MRAFFLVFSVPDKIEKALRRLSAKERAKLKKILTAIKDGNLERLDVIKLKGETSIYRVRSGAMRVIFLRSEKGIAILSVERRSETTYKDF